MDLNPSPV